MTHNGSVWRALPADFPPAWTIYYWAGQWQADGSIETMHDQLRERVRLLAGRKAAPTAAIIDSQLVKTAEEVTRSSRRYDAGKKTSDAEDVSSREGGMGLPCRGEGCVLVEACALSQAVVKAADHAVEEVALGGCVRVSGFAAPVVVGSCSG